MNSRVLWYATRATGTVALLLLTATLVLGILTTVRFARPAWPRFVTVGLHRNLPLLCVAFLALHIGTAVADSYAPVHLVDAVRPFGASYRPIWLGLGAASFDLLIALIVTSLLRTRLGHRSWRVVHWTSYACWPTAVLHGLGAGTDTKLPLSLILTAACVVAVVAALWWRLATGWPAQAGLRAGSAVLSVVLPVAAIGWLLVGPLAPGWARRAGTPAALLRRPVSVSAATKSTTATGQPANGAGQSATSLPTAPFSTAFTGTLSQSAPNAAGQIALRIYAQTTGSVAGILDIVLDGTPSDGGGISLTSSQVTFGPTGKPREYAGTISGLDGSRLTAAVTDSAGSALTLNVVVSINGSRVTGQLSASPGSGQ